MNLKSRVQKIEQCQKPVGLVLIAVNDGETNEAAYQRHFPDANMRPTTVIYVSPLDAML
jgi:hypothetical protein